ncbi:hypothetical protein ABZ234_03440 [Nocardiopsis sp. NPDC006198]|uniref:hypothetical protein n=1 Tax=Nocardiopsis sp. NPDC006198 TaxID=3154472 RepID=UPI0033B1EBF4
MVKYGAHHECEITMTMTTEQEARFRADHDLSEDEPLGPWISREMEERLRAAGPWFTHVQVGEVWRDAPETAPGVVR